MLNILVQKELKAITLSPKFGITLVVSTLLLIMSVLIGIHEYKQAVIQYDTVHEMAEERLRQVSGWRQVSYKEHRKPTPMQIFSSGLSYDIGRWTNINSQSSVKLESSSYSDDPIFAIFRVLDFTFIVQVIFSLLAILFTFDAVNGEKENGTLRLVFSNAVPRAKFILAKCIGAWLGLIIPILIPILLTLLLVVLYNIPMAVTDWIRVVSLIGVSIVYITLFLVFGVLVSTLSKRSSTSFLVSLVFWIIFVLIIPRGSVAASGHMVKVPGLAEIESTQEAYSKSEWDKYYRDSEKRWATRERDLSENGNADDEGDMWANLQVEDSIRKFISADIEKYEDDLFKDWQNKKLKQQQLGFLLARFSPAAIYQFVSTSLASTDIKVKSVYEESLRDYRREFNSYVDKKSENAGMGAGALMITMESGKGVEIKRGRDQAVDVSDRPKYEHPEFALAGIAQELILDVGLLLLFVVGLLVGAIVSFLRFDLR